ncbi:hypothetical protein GCM10018954_101770 [Kutzneria kofuensis]
MEVDDGLSSPREGQAEPAPELPLGGHRPEAPHKITRPTDLHAPKSAHQPLHGPDPKPATPETQTP